MSPLIVNTRRVMAGFPRVSGDEPAAARAHSSYIPFSPRERG